MPHAPAPGDDPGMNETATLVDLADRHSSDLDVVLMWDRRPDRFWVLVTHRASGRTGRITASGQNALDVFNHPFAYAGRER
jgi:hypothetical protein